MAARREVLRGVVAAWGRENQLEAFVEGSPVVRVRFLSGIFPECRLIERSEAR